MMWLGLVTFENARSREHCNDTDRHVDEKDPAPGEIVDKPAAEDRTSDGSQQ
jgi:hypothetical protein